MISFQSLFHLIARKRAHALASNHGLRAGRERQRGSRSPCSRARGRRRRKHGIPQDDGHREAGSQAHHRQRAGQGRKKRFKTLKNNI